MAWDIDNTFSITLVNNVMNNIIRLTPFKRI